MEKDDKMKGSTLELEAVEHVASFVSATCDVSGDSVDFRDALWGLVLEGGFTEEEACAAIWDAIEDKRLSIDSSGTLSISK